MMKVLFIIGLVIIGTAAALLLMGKIESGVAAIVGIIGIGTLNLSALKWRLDQNREKRPQEWTSTNKDFRLSPFLSKDAEHDSILPSSVSVPEGLSENAFLRESRPLKYPQTCSIGLVRNCLQSVQVSR